jgi:hypothetical protein
VAPQWLPHGLELPDTAQRRRLQCAQPLRTPVHLRTVNTMNFLPAAHFLQKSCLLCSRFGEERGRKKKERNIKFFKPKEWRAAHVSPCLVHDRIYRRGCLAQGTPSLEDGACTMRGEWQIRAGHSPCKPVLVQQQFCHRSPGCGSECTHSYWYAGLVEGKHHSPGDDTRPSTKAPYALRYRVVAASPR